MNVSIHPVLTTPNTGISSVSLGNQGAGGGALVSPGRGQDTDGLVVARQTVDTGLDQDEAELGVLVLAVALEVLADGHRLRNPISPMADTNVC